MLPLPRGAVWQTLFLLCAMLFINEVRSEGRVVCYYTNWSVYRPGTAKFNPQNINPYLCTHLVYAFGGFTKDNQMKPFDKYQDIEQGGYAKFTGLKTYNKQLKTMIAIGGWNEASSRFSPLMANPERRQQFIKNILKFLRQNHFDGIDLDWEYPAQREGGKPRDRDNYAQFVQELRAEFERESQKTGRPRLLLTMAVPAGIENIEKGYDIPKLNKYLDWFNVLSYDFHSSHEPSANHHAPLYSLEEESEYNYDAELNIDYSIKYYLKAGADRDKLVLGIPTYGRSYTLINEESTELGAPSEGPGEQGDATREKGYLAYYEICQNMKDDPEWTVVQPNPNAMGPYAYRRNQWVGYDDEAIVRKKAQYVVEHGLGGIMFWAIDNDDFRGTCTGKPYPLIEAAKDAMLDGLGLGINEVAKPNVPKKPSRSRSRENSSSKLNRISGSSEGKGSASRTTLSSGRRRVQSTTTTTTRVPETTIRLTNPEGSSLYIGGRVTTPAPPTTPDPGTDFKCEEEGFFQHPRDCKKYYWCLDSGPSGLGIVGHQFTCPSGLYFNPAADSCDFARNVPCKTKKATIAASVSSTTTTTTTPRPTASPNRISAATSRTSFFRTTTSTTPAPDEYEEEEEEEVEEPPAHAKDRDAEEDPQVIKELIELIRKVGGLEELEKHLFRKDDGTISIKGGSSESGVATTPTPISKNLYDKVLSKPNTFNSFRNRFTSASLFRKSGQTKTEDSTSTKLESEESQSSEGASSSGYSKYSSVVRSNSRQGPQNEGLDKLSEFDGFLKEKKQYVTINRHRGSFRGQEDEDEVEEKQTAEEVNENAEEEELSNRSKTTKRPTNTVTPSYTSIKRLRPTTPRVESDEEAEGSDEEVKTVKESEEKRTYTSLNRNRSRFTTTESNQPADEAVTNSNRYKYLERTRPTNRLQTSASSQDDDEEDQEDEQNVTVQLNGAEIDSTQKSTQTTTRNYANIGRRTTTTTTETPITTQETPTRYNLLENTFNNNETPEPILPTTTTTVTTANDSPALSITIKNTNPQLIPIATKQTITTTSQPIISTTNAAATTTTSNDIELIDTKSIITTLLPNFESASKEALDLSHDVNSLIEKSALSPNESPKDMEPAETTTARTTKTTTTTETLTSTATTATATDTDQIPNADEVTNLNNNRTKTQYKFITRTRNVTKAATSTTTTNTDIDTENENENENNKIFEETKKTSLKTGSSSSTDDKLSSNIRGNTVKYSGGRRQQQSNELLTRKNQIQNQQTDSTTDSTKSITTTETAPTNEFLGTISSPRPFGYPRRRTRPNNTNPTSNADIQTTTTESLEDEPSIVKTRLTATSSSKNKKYQFNRARYETTTTTTTAGPTTTTSTTRAATNQFTSKQLYQSNRNRTAARTNQVNALVDDKGDDDVEEDGDYNESDVEGEVNEDSTITTTESTLTTSPTPTLRRIRVLKYRRPVGGNNNATLISSSVSDSSNSTNSSVTNTTNTVSESLNTPNSPERQVERTRLAPLNSTYSNAQATHSESPVSTEQVPIKRFRKVIRKLIRPVNHTTEALLSNETKVGEEVTTKTTITGAPRINSTRYGFGRGNSFRTQPVEAAGVRENDTISENNKLYKARTNLFGKGNRTHFGNGVISGSTEKQSETDEEETETDTEIETDKNTEVVTATVITEKPRAGFIRPNAKDGTTVTSGVTLSTRRPFVLSRASSTTKTAAENEEGGEEDENEEDTDEEEDYDENVDVTSTPVVEHVTEIERKRNNITKLSESTVSNGAEQTFPPRQIVATTRLRKLLPDVNTTTTIITKKLEESTAADSNTNVTPTKSTLPITKRPFGLLPRTKATESENERESNTEEQDTADIKTTTLLRRPYSVGSRLKVTQNESESYTEDPNNTEVATSNMPRRTFGHDAQTELKLNGTQSDTQEEEHVATTTKSTPLVRPTFRRKLVARRPYVPPKVSGITISTTVPTSPKPKGKFVRRKFGRFHPFNAANRNTGEGFVRTDPRGQLLPEAKRFRIQDGKRVPIPDGETLDEDEEYEEYEYENDEEEEETTTNNEPNKLQTPIPIVTIRPVTRPTGLLNKPPTTLLNALREKAAENEADNEENVVGEDENEEEEEEEDEDEDEDEAEAEAEEDVSASDDDTKEASPKFNTPTYRPKDNRVPPGARPALPTTSTPSSGNVPFNSRARQPPSSPAERANSNRFGTATLGNTRVTNRPRVVNRPQGVLPPNLPLKPIATTFERTTPVVPTKPAPFIPTNTRSYERKYTATSTETPETVSDNSLIEDLNIEALNARNKKIFDINSKKHTTLKPKIATPGANQTPTDQQQDTQDHLKQNTETENDDAYTADVGGSEQGYITTTPRTSAESDTNTDYYVNANEISSQDNGSVGERTIFTTPQTPTTTLLHVFTLSDDEQTNRPPTDSANTIGRLVPERAQPKHKVVEINRIVEITSKADKLRRKSKSNQEFLKPIGESQLQVESLPYLEQLGEISVVKFVHLVDGSDISVDGHSTVTDYTPIEATASAPVRNSLPEGVPYFVPQYAYSTESAHVRTTLEQRNGKALIPEVIRSAVETSTISLEGLFESGRQGKELNSLNNVYYIFGTDETTTTSTVNINANENETQNIEFTTPSTSTSTSSALPTATTLLTTETTTTTTASALPLIPHSDSVNNIPNEVSKTLESTTIVGNTVAEDENTTYMPLIANSTTIEATFSEHNVTLVEVNSNLVETTTSTAIAMDDTSSTDTPVKSSTYVRPVVPLPLLRPESNESSPLVITIANLDKVILSKVDRPISAENKTASTTIDQTQKTQITEPKPADSNAEYSSRFASVVEAPTNLIHDTGAKAQLTGTDVSKAVASSVGNSSESDSAASSSVSMNTTSSLSSGSIVKEIISFSTETHVVRKKKSRKHRARKLQKSGIHRFTTISPAEALTAAVTPKVVSNNEGYQSSSTSASVTELPKTTPTLTTTPRVRVIQFD